MKNYSVSVDFTMSKSVTVLAESEGDAVRKVDEMIYEHPYDYAFGFSHYVNHEVICAEEEEMV